MFLINGEYQSHLPANDRSIQFGDGCFTTARIVAGEIRFLSHHIARLQQACQRLLIPFTQWQTLAAEMAEMARSQDLAVLKVIISRGSGGRGYSPAQCGSPVRILSVSGFPSFYAEWKNAGVTLGLSSVRMGINPQLAGIKHLNRLEQVLIRAELEQANQHETIVLDSDGMMVECCAANLFWREGEAVYTPLVDRSGVNGTMRQHIMAELTRQGRMVHQVRAAPDALLRADEAFICNALMPIIPVRQAITTRYTSRELFTFLAPLCE
ncbi:4-amino-4-deoxychorismate lyase [Mangrovibacter sp. MFB070]|uniref:aminodeoxychorismate lyase n=1 Tax=Mangrovibacter sp. MFB070 TaxID=1224318 RepID=UPI0004D94525|nr:aminodeoxychorismate lyase [Mangrovibacter sp. MFB070]KEA52684.1 4-amino-4-deoxychorismate lyase [Mangrovibacter sp. MFB070]